jgi:elongator complex protein 1
VAAHGGNEDPAIPGSAVFIGLTNSGKLYLTGNSAPAQVLASNATSFIIVSSFVVFTTSVHEATFVPVSTLPSLVNAAEEGQKPISMDWEKRRVERGSRLVVGVASSMSLVLQMPRGNLETINPRPLVMEMVKQDLDA